METPLTELQCLEQLTKLAEVIERENWHHLYENLELPLSKLRQLGRLIEVNANYEEQIKELKDTLQQVKIKSMAIADLRTAMQILIDEATSQ